MTNIELMYTISCIIMGNLLLVKDDNPRCYSAVYMLVLLMLLLLVLICTKDVDFLVIIKPCVSLLQILTKDKVNYHLGF